jgi:hypothetical protein
MFHQNSKNQSTKKQTYSAETFLIAPSPRASKREFKKL